MASRSSATGVKHVTTADEARDADRPTPAPADWQATCSSTARSARTPRGCTSPIADAPRSRAATPTSTPTRSGASERLHRSRDHRGISRHRRRRSHRRRRPRSSDVVERFGAPAVARCGHRLEHLEMVTDEQAEQLGAWGVFASMQPNFDALWGGEHGMYAQRLGVDRSTRLNPFALLASQGVPLAFGSDSPVTDMNPWATVRAATTASHPRQRDLGAGGVRGRNPRRVARRRGARRRRGHPGARRTSVLRGLGGRRVRGQRPGRRRAALVHRPTTPGCPPCRDSTTALPRAGRRCIGVSSSMAKSAAGASGPNAT